MKSKSTLVVFGSNAELWKDDFFFRDNNTTVASRISHIKVIEFNKYDKVIGVNLGLSVKTELENICKLNKIKFEHMEGGKVNRKMEEMKNNRKLENEKNRLINTIKYGKRISDWDFQLVKNELKNYPGILVISLNRPNNLSNSSFFEINSIDDKISFKAIKCFDKGDKISKFIESLELYAEDIYKVEKYKNKMFVYITEEDYLCIRSKVLD